MTDGLRDDEQLVHLAGYAAIAGVLASANWSGPVGALVGGLFVLAGGAVLAHEAYVRLARRLRAEAEAAAEVYAGD